MDRIGGYYAICGYHFIFTKHCYALCLKHERYMFIRGKIDFSFFGASLTFASSSDGVDSWARSRTRCSARDWPPSIWTRYGSRTARADRKPTFLADTVDFSRGPFVE